MSNQANRVRLARQVLTNAEAAVGTRGAGTETESPQSDERAERQRQLRLFHWFASRVPLGRRFSDSVDLGLWCVTVWRETGREFREAERERFAAVVSDMWATLEQCQEFAAHERPKYDWPTLGDGPLLLAAHDCVWRKFRRGA